MYSGMLPKTCDECREKAIVAAKKAHLDALAALPMEDRVRRLEEFAYDHRRSYHHPRPVRF
jgi:hypothetical protein